MKIWPPLTLNAGFPLCLILYDGLSLFLPTPWLRTKKIGTIENYGTNVWVCAAGKLGADCFRRGKYRWKKFSFSVGTCHSQVTLATRSAMQQVASVSDTRSKGCGSALSKWIMQHFAFPFLMFQAWGVGGEAFPVTINIWSLLPCKQMHCRAFQLFCQTVGLQQQNEFSRIADIYPKQSYSVLSSKSPGGPYLTQTPTGTQETMLSFTGCILLCCKLSPIMWCVKLRTSFCCNYCAGTKHLI